MNATTVKGPGPYELLICSLAREIHHVVEIALAPDVYEEIPLGRLSAWP